MSWMDSWSRPTKSQATPVPFYLIPGSEDTPYCRTCGRVISSRKTAETASSSTPAKYCSSRCRSHKPGALDRRIESAFVKFLTGEEPLPEAKGGKTEKKGGKKGKGDPRVLVPVDVVERYVFRHGEEPQGDHETRDSAGSELGSAEGADEHDLGSAASGSVRSTDDLDDHLLDTAPQQVDGHRVAAMSVRSGTRVRPPQEVSEVNGSVGGEKGRAERKVETTEALEKRLEGQKRTKEKEMVRSAARRGVVFGFLVGDGEDRKKCEAVMHGNVVEPSYAKGDWSIRWRE
ncbi:hypothetical protein CONLIGDRAFT_709966 [Coniochaeta ligniaria NRRL 30616]|uniref:Uncharacterized protein n=1 Tax=Coniochaeta ligniaria NRRL 30616 TaxID=1408157 RepID=A0A1J7J3L1_9PEZI|nr:hypothetical protein CONLIGDRAFT_709966 [Coniochaeta ligniaria NRRL 30616]